MPTDPNQAGPPTAEEQILQEATAAGSLLRNLSEIPFMLGGLTFIVPPKAMTVKQAIKVDEVSIPKKSGKVRHVTGYEPAEITVELEVCDEEGLDGVLVQPALERLRILQCLFRDGRAALPTAVEIVSPLTDLIGIRQVFIQELTANEDGTFDWIPVHLVLTEYESVKTQLENQAAGAGASNAAAAQGAEEIEGNEELNRELGYVRDQFNAGMEEGSGAEAPSEDLDDPDE